MAIRLLTMSVWTLELLASSQTIIFQLYSTDSLSGANNTEQLTREFRQRQNSHYILAE